MHKLILLTAIAAAIGAILSDHGIYRLPAGRSRRNGKREHSKQPISV
jgi:hypothetical protein